MGRLLLVSLQTKIYPSLNWNVFRKLMLDAFIHAGLLKSRGLKSINTIWHGGAFLLTAHVSATKKFKEKKRNRTKSKNISDTHRSLD